MVDNAANIARDEASSKFPSLSRSWIKEISKIMKHNIPKHQYV